MQRESHQADKESATGVAPRRKEHGALRLANRLTTDLPTLGPGGPPWTRSVDNPLTRLQPRLSYQRDKGQGQHMTQHQHHGE